MENKRVVYYSEFGAIGDGVAEDFPAIVKCHEYANANGCKVMADPGATYYIAETDGVEAIIKTDVDWGDATFIIDDRNIPVPSKSRTAHIFRVLGEQAKKVYGEDSDIIKAINEAGGFKAGATHIGYAPGYTALLAVFNDQHSAYIRWGCHATGKPNPLRELVVVDAEGNIDPSTTFLLDFDHVSRIEELRADDAPITLENGKFITRANAVPPVYTAYNRGIGFTRANVTIRNTIHEITDEGHIGAPYGGFISWYLANNLRCENLKLQSHKSYKDYEYDADGKVVKIHSVMGSYDVGGSLSTNIYFKDCVQTNFYKWEEKNIAYNEGERWGIMGTNYCKNLTYDGCVFSRLDAHAGVYNVTIKDTTISYIKLTGGGKALIENCKIVAPEGLAIALFELRSDYGSTWKGDIEVKNCEFINWTAPNVYLASALWNNWNFGYVTHLPHIILDGLKIDKPTANIYAFTDVCRDHEQTIDAPTLKDGTPNINPMDISTTITLKNNEGGYHYMGSVNPYVNERIKIEEL